MLEGAEQAVVDHRIVDRVVTEAVSAARFQQQIGRVGHGLHAAGDGDVGLAAGDHLIREIDRIDPGETHLVDDRRRCRHRYAALDGRLPRRGLTRTAEQHLAHVDVVDLLARDTRASERSRDGEAAEVRCAESGEAAGQLADRRACAVDDDRSRHGESLSVALRRYRRWGGSGQGSA